MTGTTGANGLPDGLRLSLFYGACFLWGGVQLVFWPLWLESRGLLPQQIGLLQGIGICVRACTVPLIAGLADRRDARRALLRVLCVVATCCAVGFVWARGFVPLLLVSVTFTAFASALTPLCDSMAVLLGKRGGMKYGRMRLWGSTSFLLVTLGSSLLLQGRDAEPMVALLLIGLAISIVASLWLPDLRAGVPERDQRATLRAVLRLPRFVPLLLAIGCVQASHAAYYWYSTLHWQKLGFSEPAIGALWSLGVVVEIVLFRHADRVRTRVGLRGLLLIGACGGVLRWSLIASSSSLLLLLPAQVLHAATFAATQVCAIGCFEKIVPAPLVSSAQSLYVALPFGLMMGSAMALSGWLFAIAPAAAFAAMAVLAGLGVLGAGQLRGLDQEKPGEHRAHGGPVDNLSP